MKLLITGGAGFIGSNFIRYILSNNPGWQVVNLDKLTYAGNLENLADIDKNPKYSFVKGDIADISQVNSLFSQYKFDFVVNFAAESHVDRSILDPGLFIETNIKGTQTLLEVCRKYGVGRFIQISTDEVYGSLDLDEPPFTEESPLQPNNPYAASKAAADLLIRSYHQTYGLNCIITRCTNNYGPYQFPEKLIPLTITNALEDKRIPIYGDGKNIRDWIYVEDHCRAISAIIQKGCSGKVYNIGANHELQNIDVVKGILTVMRKPISLIEYVPDRLGHDSRYALNTDKIEREIGWCPRYNFLDKLPDVVQWYVENREWWQKDFMSKKS